MSQAEREVPSHTPEWHAFAFYFYHFWGESLGGALRLWHQSFNKFGPCESFESYCPTCIRRSFAAAFGGLVIVAAKSTPLDTAAWEELYEIPRQGLSKSHELIGKHKDQIDALCAYVKELSR